HPEVAARRSAPASAGSRGAAVTGRAVRVRSAFARCRGGVQLGEGLNEGFPLAECITCLFEHAMEGEQSLDQLRIALEAPHESRHVAKAEGAGDLRNPCRVEIKRPMLPA